MYCDYAMEGCNYMAKSVYFNGKLIPAKDWDYDRKAPKVKEAKLSKKEEPAVEVESPLEVEATPEA